MLESLNAAAGSGREPLWGGAAWRGVRAEDLERYLDPDSPSPLRLLGGNSGTYRPTKLNRVDGRRHYLRCRDQRFLDLPGAQHAPAHRSEEGDAAQALRLWADAMGCPFVGVALASTQTDNSTGAFTAACCLRAVPDAARISQAVRPRVLALFDRLMPGPYRMWAGAEGVVVKAMPGDRLNQALSELAGIYFALMTTTTTTTNKSEK